MTRASGPRSAAQGRPGARRDAPSRDDHPVGPARAILQSLDALGIERVSLVTGGSVGGMIVLCLAVLAPERFERIAPIAAASEASAWVVGWNHVARRTVLADPGYPHDCERGLELARQLATLTYRAEPGMDAHHGRGRPRPGETQAPGWSSRGHYPIQSYLEHQGAKLRARFDARSYLALLGAMDHHDLSRPPSPTPGESGVCRASRRARCAWASRRTSSSPPGTWTRWPGACATWAVTRSTPRSPVPTATMASSSSGSRSTRCCGARSPCRREEGPGRWSPPGRSRASGHCPR
ncbi:alpha/beta fold hydrolase [Cystobacter fuscus]